MLGRNRFSLKPFAFRLVAALAIALSLGSAVARAQTMVASAEYDELFRRVLREPANLDLSFRFAEAATRIGDYEAAIGALERMLFYNPNLPRVKLELGILYFRLGSYEMARSYFRGALAAPDAPLEIRGRVEGFLAEIERRLSTTQWSVYGQTGLRHQSNANAGPSSSLVRGAGLDVILDRRYVRQPDWNAFGVAAIRHVYDFENQRGDVWETSLVGYAARQFHVTRLDLGLAEIQTGPRFALFPDQWVGLALRPYVLANSVALGGSPYLRTLGGGVSLSMPFPNGAVLEPFFEGRQRRFGNTRDYPLADEQTGRLWSTGITGQGPVWGPIRWQTRLAVIRDDARRDYDSYNQIALDVGFPVELEMPWPGSRKWVLTPYAGVSSYHYDQPNAIIDPNVARRDREWRVGTVLDAQIFEGAGLGLQVQYAVIDSNIRNYDLKNFSVVFGPTVRF